MRRSMDRGGDAHAFSDSLHGWADSRQPIMSSQSLAIHTMQMFPDSRIRLLNSNAISVVDARAILERDGSRIALMAIETIETNFEPDPAEDRTTARMLEEIVETAGDSEGAIALRRIRDRILASTTDPVPEPPLAFSTMDGFTFDEDVRSDWDTDCLIIEGDLNVGGTLHLNDLDELRCVVVLGSVTTENFICGGWVFVRDNLTCKHIYASSLNDGGLFVGGNVQVDTLLETGQYVHVAGNFEASYLATVQNEIEVDGEVRCPNFALRSDRDRLPLWVDPRLIKQHHGEDDEGRPYQYWYPDGYDERILAGGSPVKGEG
ncbi:hypothetical protein [Stenotrophomonas sp. SMYL20]|uniref:hypothetical protein n=1 Tax=Stenotrophomonas sp. SMYL20 TaxID=3076043 RepID=UPI002E76043A|nr:hypothetical protein [Stenotrophomonas sp. SMYL20]